MPTSDVGTVAGYLNEILDLNPSNYKVQINWGDSGAWDPDSQPRRTLGRWEWPDHRY